VNFHSGGSISVEARELCGWDDKNFAAKAAEIEKYG
jgi:hypothetical protein